MTDKDARANLDSTKCRCGNRKYMMSVLCSKCYWRLPLFLRRNLYKGFTEGFAKACEQAFDFLDKKEIQKTRKDNVPF